MPRYSLEVEEGIKTWWFVESESPAQARLMYFDGKPGDPDAEVLTFERDETFNRIVKVTQLTDLAPHQDQALRAAVLGIYFDGGSRMSMNALWDVVKALDPNMADVLAKDPAKAARMVDPEMGADDDDEEV